MVAPPDGGFFVAQNTILDQADVRRAITRMAHEIIERNSGLESVVVIGLQAGGVPIADALVTRLEQIEDTRVPLGHIDVAFYRDDISLRPIRAETSSDVTFDVTDKVVVLVDDVLFTGRTIRAALDAVIDRGRPKSIQLAVLVDRGHRELPIRPDYVGKNLPTRADESVTASLDGVVIGKAKL